MQYFETVLGAQNMIYAKWLVAFAVVLILAVVLLRLLRGLMGSSLNMSERGSTRGRVPRLGVTEFFNLDKQGRRLVIVRRDNIEHLVLIGGPNDVLIESNIVRADRSSAPRIEPRDAAPSFGKPDNDAQPRLEPMPARQISAPAMEAPEPRLAPLPLGDRQPVVDIPREDLALRLEEVLRKPLPPKTPPEPAPVAPPIPVQVSHPSPAPVRPASQPRPPEPVLRQPEPPRQPEPRRIPEPVLSPPPRIPEPSRTPEPSIIPDRSTAEAVRSPEPSKPEALTAKPPEVKAPEVKPPEPKPSESRSQDVLASILKPRMPLSPLTPPTPEPAQPAAPVEPVEAAKPSVTPPPPPPPAEAAPAPAEPKPVVQPPAPKNPFDSLEEEMARLLGRGLGDKQ